MNRPADNTLVLRGKGLPRPAASLVVVLMTALALPAIATLLLLVTAGDGAQNLLRKMGESPAPTVEQLRTLLMRQVALRPQVLEAHARLSLMLFGRPATEKVVPGRDGWLFYGEGSAVRYYRRSDPFSPDDLARWAAALDRRRAVAEAHGSRYFVVISPDKPTIYPEFLPASLQPLNAPSRLDQLLAYLRSNTRVQVIDLRPALWNAKSAERLYHRTDTHWNDLGAFVAARVIIQTLSQADPRLTPPERGDYVLASRHHVGTDLANMTGVSDRFPERLLTLSPRTPGPELYSVNRYESVAQQPAADLPTIHLFHTSYGEVLRPLLTPHFRASRFRFLHAFDAESVAPAGEPWPDFVLSEFAERNLALPPPEDNIPTPTPR